MANLTYEDYKQRLNIQDILVEAGYVRNRRDGLRYPSYVRLDEDGRRIRGDKFIVTQNSQCCFHPPVQKSYNIISFIKEHPELFRDYTSGMNLDLLVNKVCCKLLNTTYDESKAEAREPAREPKPFRLEDYDIHRFEGRDKESQKAFYPYFKHRGIDLSTQFAFRKNFVLASRTTSSSSFLRNLSFPLTIPGKDDTVVGFEERGRMRRDGEKSYKGKAEGSNASEGLWIASPAGTKLENAGRVLLFESAYDAMAYYQLRHKDDKELKNAVFVSTGGTPTVSQMKGIIRNSPSATFHLCFDNDTAGKQFVKNFENVMAKEKPYSQAAVDFKNTTGNIEIDHEKEMAFDKLPEDVRKKYYAAFRLAEEYPTAYLCPEDREAMKKDIHEKFKDFNRAVDGCIISIRREVPSEGYKDWNDELLGEMEETTKKAVGSDIDGDGEVEIEESNEEKHHYHR
jgi:hypothetical protein